MSLVLHREVLLAILAISCNRPTKNSRCMKGCQMPIRQLSRVSRSFFWQSLPQVVLNSLPKLVVMSSSRLLPLSHRVQLAAFKSSLNTTPIRSWGPTPTEVRTKLMQPLLQLSLKPQKMNTNASSTCMLLKFASAKPRFLSELSHLASKSLQHLVWVIRPS